VAKAVEERGWEFIRIDRGNPYRRTPLIFWLEDCAAWCAGGWRTGELALSDVVQTWLTFNQGVSSEAGQRQLRIALVRFLYQRRENDVALRTWLTEFRELVLLERFDADELLREHDAAVIQLQEVTAEGGRLSSFTVSTFAGQAGTSDHLNLMTLHSAKGLEFDVVIMVGLEQGRTPGYQAIKARRNGNVRPLKEDRRLFYVGLTRARHEVHLLYSGWYVNQYGTPFQNGRSEFIDEVGRAIAYD
jgi:DNA helicase-2/ATP-dependent DNA helicase PcrA